MPIRKMQDVDLAGKTVVIREDLNVPMKDGGVSNDKRIRAALPTIRLALEKGAGPRKGSLKSSSPSSPWRPDLPNCWNAPCAWPPRLRKPRPHRGK